MAHFLEEGAFLRDSNLEIAGDDHVSDDVVDGIEVAFASSSFAPCCIQKLSLFLPPQYGLV